MSVPGGGASKAVYFPIVLTQIGNVELWVTAQAGAQAGDAVQQTLKVEPEGYRVDRNVPLVVDLSNSERLSTAKTVVEPTNAAVQETVSAVVASGNSATNLENSEGLIWKKVIEMQFPEDFVEGSRKAKIDIIGKLKF